MTENAFKPAISPQGILIRTQLQHHKKSQAWLARQCGVTPGQISHIIMGTRKPSLLLLNKIALALQIDVGALLQKIAG